MSEPTTSAPAAPHPELAALVEVWWSAVNDFVTLLEELSPADWALATDLDGWDVHAVAAHTAHLEALQAGADHDDVEIGAPVHVRNDLGKVTEQGVVARRDRTPDELIEEIRRSTTAHHTALLAAPPHDPSAPAPGLFGLVGWTTRTLLRNRPLDVSLHEQDIRRAVGRHGNLSSPALVHSADYLAESLGFVLGKRAGAAPGTSLRLDVAGHTPQAWQVGEDGRGHVMDDVPLPGEADVALACDRETFLLLAGGRRTDAETLARVQVTGDADLAAVVLSNLAVTP